jgi:prolipoprotein diacylglyceryltransferase
MEYVVQMINYPVTPMVFAMAAYQPLIKIMQAVLRKVNPILYTKFSKDKRRKLDPYFVFVLGFLLTITTTPYCARAVTDTPLENSGFRFDRTMTIDGQVCLASRAALWISELPILSYSPQYKVHHILSLSSLCVVILGNGPLRPLYLIYSGLITELLSDTTSVLKIHDWNSKNSAVFRGLQLANAILLVLIRGFPAVLLIPGTFLLVTRMNDVLWISSLVLYSTYMFHLSFKQISDLGLLSFTISRPAHFTVMDRVKLPLFSVFIGLAMATTQLSTAILFEKHRANTTTGAEVRSMAIAAVESTVVGLFGVTVTGASSALTSLSTTDQDTIRNYKKTTRNLSIQGAVAFMSLWMVLNRTLEQSIQRDVLLAAMALSLPLGEAVGRIGCYLAGCCGPVANKSSRRMPLQLVVGLLNFVAFGVLAMGLSTNYLSLVQAGTLAVLANGAIRFLAEISRSERLWRITSKTVAAGQFLSALAILVRISSDLSAVLWYTATIVLPAVTIVYLASNLIWSLLCTVAKIQRLVLFSAVGGVVAFLGAVDAARMLSEAAKSADIVSHRSEGNIVSDPIFLMSTLVTFLIPVVVRHGILDRCG